MDKTYICIHLASHLITGAGSDVHKFKRAELARNVDGMEGEVSSSVQRETSWTGDVCPPSLFFVLQASCCQLTFMAKVICN